MASNVSTTQRQQEFTGLNLLPHFLQTSSEHDAKLRVDLARDWDQFLHPLVAKHFSAKFGREPLSDATTFTDAEGRFLYLGHTKASYFVPELLELLKAEKDDSIEIEELDKVRSCALYLALTKSPLIRLGGQGSLFFTLQKHPSGKWVVSQTRINLYGWVGNFTDYVMVEDLAPFVNMLEGLEKLEA
jgi:hypothetical protein